MGWFLFLNENTDPATILDRYAKDLMKDPFFAWIEASAAWVLVVIASVLAIFGAGFSVELLGGGSMAEAVRLGLSLVVWGVFVRTVVVWHLTWSTASCTHRWGYRNYETADESRNNAVLSLLVMGEGWANNHHAFPRSPRFTARWWELDASWLVIKALAWAGIVKVNPASFPRPTR
jgi:stearoyl-CoA desaturase (delta-9 desaturase)